MPGVVLVKRDILCQTMAQQGIDSMCELCKKAMISPMYLSRAIAQNNGVVSFKNAIRIAFALDKDFNYLFRITDPHDAKPASAERKRKECTYCIYKHTFPDGKVYIGQTITGCTNRRWSNGNGYKSQPVYKAIMRYGWDNIEHEIIEDGIPAELIDEREKYYIDLYDSFKNGYNSLGTETKSRRLQLLVYPSIYKALEKEAKERRISVNSAINLVLKEFIDACEVAN